MIAHSYVNSPPSGSNDPSEERNSDGEDEERINAPVFFIIARGGESCGVNDS